jgi:hypothetical protein
MSAWSDVAGVPRMRVRRGYAFRAHTTLLLQVCEVGGRDGALDGRGESPETVWVRGSAWWRNAWHLSQGDRAPEAAQRAVAVIKHPWTTALQR